MFKQHNGQSMTEFIIVMPVLLILIFGGFQFALIYHAKITLNYATFLAARSGAVANGHMGVMENALARGMAPLYTHCEEIEEVKRARNKVQDEIRNGFGRIEIINPLPAAFTDFKPISAPNSDRYIPNDNLMYRSTATTGSSGINIQDANVLKIRASYCYPMYVPYVNTLIKTLLMDPPSPDCEECLGTIPAGSGTFEAGCLINDRFPINSQAIVRMQSPAYENMMYVTASTAPGLYPGPAAANTTITPVLSSCP